MGQKAPGQVSDGVVNEANRSHLPLNSTLRAHYPAQRWRGPGVFQV